MIVYRMYIDVHIWDWILTR